MLLRFVFLLCCVSSVAQQVSIPQLQERHPDIIRDSVVLKTFITNIYELKRAGNYNDALSLNTWLLTKIDSANTPYYYAETIYMRSRVEIDLGNYSQSIASTKQAKYIYEKLNEKESIAAANNLIGVGYYFQTKLDSTLYYYQASYDLKRALGVGLEQLAISTYNIGIVYEDLARYQEAITMYNSTVGYLKELNDPDVNFLPSVYLAIANTYNRSNNLVKAEEYTTLALTVGIELYGEDNPEMSFVYESNSSIYTVLENYEKAKKFEYKALKIREKNYGKTHRWTTQSYTDLAELFIETKQLDSAAICIKKAITIGEKVGNKLDIAEAYIVQANVLQAQQKWSLALPYVEKSRLYSTEIYGNTHELVAEAYINEAKLYIALNKIEHAMQSIAAALKAAHYQPEDINTLVAPFVALEGLSLKFRAVSEDKKMRLIDEEMALIKKIRRLYHSQQAKVFFANTTSKIISDAIDYCYHAYQQNKDETYLEKALALVQLNTNSVLVEERYLVQENQSSDVVSKAFERVASLRQQWAIANQELFYEETATAPSKKAIDSLIQQRVAFSRDLDAAIVAYDAISENKTQEVPTVTISEIKEKIAPDAQILQYYVGASQVYVFIITSEIVEIYQLALTQQVEDIISVLRENLLARKLIDNQIKQLSKALEINIISPFKNKITILTNGMLAYVPFEILETSTAEMLVQKYAIRYQPALGLWNQGTPKSYNFDNYWSGFGVAYKGMNQLPKGIEEIKTIAEVTKGSVFLDDAVNKETLFKQGKKSEILHLALHGNVEPKNSLYSAFLLKDSALTASEIYNSEIASKLVVLSACETGYGTIENGEGVMSLSRAFTFAGAQSTVMSLWEVPDKETAKIMTSFYIHLKEGQSKDVALQKAKQDYLEMEEDEALKHPFYWAGFVLSGDTAPIQNSTPLYLHIVLGVLLLLVIGFYFYFKRGKKETTLS